MTDADLVQKKLAQIETYVAELRRLARPELLDTDLRERRFAEHTLQIAIQACQDVASHIVSDDRLGEPRTNRDLFEILAREGWIDEDLAAVLRRAVALRNVIVHGYTTVDLTVVRDVLEHRLDDLEAFTTAVRNRLAQI